MRTRRVLSLRGTFSSVGSVVVSVVILAAISLIALGVLRGVVWVAELLLPIAMFFAVLGGLVVVFMLGHAWMVEADYRWSGLWIVIASYTWGITLWMWATRLLYDLWGLTGLFLGLVLLGVGSVPMAVIALLFSSEFKVAGLVVLASSLVFGVRSVGNYLIAKATREQIPDLLIAAPSTESRSNADSLLPYRWGFYFGIFSATMCVLGLVGVPVLVVTGKTTVWAGVGRMPSIVLLGLQGWGLTHMKRYGLVALYLLCCVVTAQCLVTYIHFPHLEDFTTFLVRLPVSPVDEPLINFLLYLASAYYFFKRRRAFV